MKFQCLRNLATVPPRSTALCVKVPPNIPLPKLLLVLTLNFNRRCYFCWTMKTVEETISPSLGNKKQHVTCHDRGGSRRKGKRRDEK